MGSLSNTKTMRLKEIHRLLKEFSSSPHSHDLIELGIATVTSLVLSSQDHPSLVWLLVSANPSSGKTETILTLKGVPSVFYLDTLTENSFLSGYVEDRRNSVVIHEEPKSQLIDTLNGKCLVIKDLTTLFSERDEKVKMILGQLQSIYDGEFAKATGTLGVLTSSSRFSMMACVTPKALQQHRNYMSMIGGRFLTYQLPALTPQELKRGLDCIWNEQNIEHAKQAIRLLVNEHVEELLQEPVDLQEEKPVVRRALNSLAILLARGRGILLTEPVPRIDEQTGQPKYAYEITGTQIEEPFRAVQQVRTLGRALARVHGRKHITNHELELLRKVVFGSMLNDRAEYLALFQGRKTGLKQSDFGSVIPKSPSGIRASLDQLERLQLVESTMIQDERIYKPAKDVAAVLSKKVRRVDHMADLFPAKKDTQNSPYTHCNNKGDGIGVGGEFSVRESIEGRGEAA